MCEALGECGSECKGQHTPPPPLTHTKHFFETTVLLFSFPSNTNPCYPSTFFVCVFLYFQLQYQYPFKIHSHLHVNDYVMTINYVLVILISFQHQSLYWDIAIFTVALSNHKKLFPQSPLKNNFPLHEKQQTCII